MLSCNVNILTKPTKKYKNWNDAFGQSPCQQPFQVATEQNTIPTRENQSSELHKFSANKLVPIGQSRQDCTDLVPSDMELL